MWRTLSEGEADDRIALIALEQLAICYEHRLGDPEKAAEATQRALQVYHSVLAAERAGRCARLARRLQRLQRKLSYCTSFLE